MIPAAGTNHQRGAVVRKGEDVDKFNKRKKSFQLHKCIKLIMHLYYLSDNKN